MTRLNTNKIAQGKNISPETRITLQNPMKMTKNTVWSESIIDYGFEKID